MGAEFITSTVCVAPRYFNAAHLQSHTAKLHAPRGRARCLTTRIACRALALNLAANVIARSGHVAHLVALSLQLRAGRCAGEYGGACPRPPRLIRGRLPCQQHAYRMRTARGHTANHRRAARLRREPRAASGAGAGYAPDDTDVYNRYTHRRVRWPTHHRTAEQNERRPGESLATTSRRACSPLDRASLRC